MRLREVQLPAYVTVWARPAHLQNLRFFCWTGYKTFSAKISMRSIKTGEEERTQRHWPLGNSGGRRHRHRSGAFKSKLYWADSFTTKVRSIQALQVPSGSSVSLGQWNTSSRGTETDAWLHPKHPGWCEWLTTAGKLLLTIFFGLVTPPGWIFLGFWSWESLQGAQAAQWNSPERQTLPSENHLAWSGPSVTMDDWSTHVDVKGHRETKEKIGDVGVDPQPCGALNASPACYMGCV